MFTKKIQKDVHTQKNKNYVIYYKGTLNNQAVKVSHSMNM